MRKVNMLSSEDESSEFDKDVETAPTENNESMKDNFWLMPPLLKTPVLDINRKKMNLRTKCPRFISKERYCLVIYTPVVVTTNGVVVTGTNMVITGTTEVDVGGVVTGTVMVDVGGGLVECTHLRV
ncbi:hypothetical protein CTI12_AA520980 [Artemisia annua]|uniref:Uncharacterized protein n=1 Tax=Artemisia annua TaxID=35608 RepID=A0A2U1L7R2_ARTAN|nr:hypothetical protein CTI12_AA520980 [Artemisia annua]